MHHKLIQSMPDDWSRLNQNAADQCRLEKQTDAKVAWRDMGNMVQVG